MNFGSKSLVRPAGFMALIGLAGLMANPLAQSTDLLKPTGRWVPFSADFTVTRTANGVIQTGQGKYWRASDGSVRTELTRLPGGFVPPTPGIGTAEIKSAADHFAYYRWLDGKWYRVPIPEGMYRTTFTPSTPGPNALKREGMRDGLTLYRAIRDGGPSVDWYAEELGFFCVRSIQGPTETTYHDIKIGEPSSNLFLPPPGMEVTTVPTFTELTRLFGSGK